MHFKKNQGQKAGSNLSWEWERKEVAFQKQINIFLSIENTVSK